MLDTHSSGRLVLARIYDCKDKKMFSEAGWWGWEFSFRRG
jgi:hypothetical protein